MRQNIIAAYLVALAVCVFNPRTFGQENQKMNTLILARDGKANATIVIAPDATRAAQFAAFELRYHLNRITGGDFPIATNGVPAKGISILVGNSSALRALKIAPETLGLQEYLIRFLPDTLVLVGRDKADRGKVGYDYMSDPDAFKSWPGMWTEQGTMYAVYDFLERFCGVRWFNHTETGMVCPENRDLTIKGLEIRRAPQFRYRYACDYGDAVYANTTSLWPRESDGFNRWDKTAYANAHASGKYSTAKTGCVQLFRRRMREGGEQSICNHSLYNYYDRFWEQSKDTNLAKIFVAKKADWFAKGYTEGARPPQLCYTSTGLIEQVAQDAAAYFKGESTSIGLGKFQWGENYFAVEPMDTDSFCRCAECQKLLNAREEKSVFFSNGRHSDYFFNFVNEVAKRVKQTNPDKRVITLAYMSHAAPPERVKLDPGVAVQFCFACSRLVFDRQSYEHELKLLAAWADEAKETKRPLYVYLYYTFPWWSAVCGKFNCFPGFFAHAIGEQFKLFHRYGYRGMFLGDYGQEVEAYISFKLIDDPTLNVDALLDEYFAGLYGPAADALKKFYLLVEKTYCDPQNYPPEIATGKLEGHHHQTEEIAWRWLGTEERMLELGKLMEQARAAVAVNGTAAQKTNVDLFDKAFWSYMVMGRNRWLEKRDEITPDNSQKLPDRWKVMMDPAKGGITNKWFEINYDDSSWKEASILEFLEKQGFKDYKYAWYRTSALVPKEWEGKKIILHFGAVDETCWLWINGRSAGEFIYNGTLDPGSWERPLRFDITKFIKFGEKNQITVLVQNLTGAGGIWKPSYILYKPKDWNPDGFKIISPP